jgi:thiol:disulfide interchange protein DsbG
MAFWRVSFLALILTLGVASGPVRAADMGPAGAVPMAVDATAAAPDPKTVPGLQMPLRDGADIHWLGRQGGYNAWIFFLKEQPFVVYTPLTGNGFFVGSLYSNDGTNQTVQQIDAFRERNPQLMSKYEAMTMDHTPPLPDASTPGERLFAGIEKTNWVSVGKATAPYFYMIVDPSCKFCKAYWKEVAPYVKNGSIQIRLVPVGILGDKSKRKAAGLLSSTDPLSAWDRHVDGDDKALRDGAGDTYAAMVLANEAFMGRWNLKTTPYSIYRGREASIQVVDGVPANVRAVLNDVAPPVPRRGQ